VIPAAEDAAPAPNGARLHLPALKWATAFGLVLFVSVAVLSWLAWGSLREWEWNRLNQQAISMRIAEDRVKINLHQARLLNELRLQTFNQMLPPADQQRLLPALLARLDEDTQRTVTALRLRSLMGAGEQESQVLPPQRPQRRQAP
jgi:hypothetical protein